MAFPYIPGQQPVASPMELRSIKNYKDNTIFEIRMELHRFQCTFYEKRTESSAHLPQKQCGAFSLRISGILTTFAV